MAAFLTLLGMFVSVMLIGIILLQRGRGGGLVGALSGLGGQSAFGTKAGDMFTRITIGIAAVWVILAGVSGQVLRARTSKFIGNEPASINKPADEKQTDSASDNDFLGGLKASKKNDDATSSDNGKSKSDDQGTNAKEKSDEGETSADKEKSDNAEAKQKPETKKLDDEKSDDAKPDADKGENKSDDKSATDK